MLTQKELHQFEGEILKKIFRTTLYAHVIIIIFETGFCVQYFTESYGEVDFDGMARIRDVLENFTEEKRKEIKDAIEFS